MAEFKLNPESGTRSRPLSPARQALVYQAQMISPRSPTPVNVDEISPTAPRPYHWSQMPGSLTSPLKFTPVEPDLILPVWSEPFRLLDLPLEMQRLIISHCLGGVDYDITVECERLTMLRSRYLIIGYPLPGLLYVCRHLSNLTSEIRHQLFSGRLVLNSVFTLIPLKRQARFEWLRCHTRFLHFSDSSINPERWSTYFDCFKHMQRLEVHFPNSKSLSPVPPTDLRKDKYPDLLRSTREVLDGAYDEIMISSLDKFKLALLAQLRHNKIEVFIWQRFSCACSDLVESKEVVSVQVDVEIRLTELDTVVARRTLSDHVTGKQDYRDLSNSIIRANGNMIDAGLNRGIFELWSAMNGNI